MIKEVTQVDKFTWVPRRETEPRKNLWENAMLRPTKGSEKEEGKEAGGSAEK